MGRQYPSGQAQAANNPAPKSLPAEATVKSVSDLLSLQAPEGSSNVPIVDKSNGNLSYEQAVMSLTSTVSPSFGYVLKYSTESHYPAVTTWNKELQTSEVGLGWTVPAVNTQIIRSANGNGIAWDDQFYLSGGGSLTPLLFVSEDSSSGIKTYTTSEKNNWFVKWYPAQNFDPTSFDPTNLPSGYVPSYWEVTKANGTINRYGAYNPTSATHGYATAQQYTSDADLTGLTTGDGLGSLLTTVNAGDSYDYLPVEHGIIWNGSISGAYSTDTGQEYRETAWNLTEIENFAGNATVFNHLRHLQKVGNGTNAKWFTISSYPYQMVQANGDALVVDYELKAESDEFQDPRTVDEESATSNDAYQERYKVFYTNTVSKYIGSYTEPVMKTYFTYGADHDNTSPYIDQNFGLYKRILTGLSFVDVGRTSGVEKRSAPTILFDYYDNADNSALYSSTAGANLYDSGMLYGALKSLTLAGGSMYEITYNQEDSGISTVFDTTISGNTQASDGNYIPSAKRVPVWGSGYMLLAGEGVNTAQNDATTAKVGIFTWADNGWVLSNVDQNSTSTFDFNYERYSSQSSDPKNSNTPNYADLISAETGWFAMLAPTGEDSADSTLQCADIIVWTRGRGDLSDLWSSRKLTSSPLCAAQQKVYYYTGTETATAEINRLPQLATSDDTILVSYADSSGAIQWQRWQTLDQWTSAGGVVSKSGSIANGDSDSVIGAQAGSWGVAVLTYSNLAQNNFNNDNAIANSYLYATIFPKEDSDYQTDFTVESVVNSIYATQSADMSGCGPGDSNQYGLTDPREFVSIGNGMRFQLMVAFTHSKCGFDEPIIGAADYWYPLDFRFDFAGEEVPSTSSDVTVSQFLFYEDYDMYANTNPDMYMATAALASPGTSMVSMTSVELGDGSGMWGTYNCLAYFEQVDSDGGISYSLQSGISSDSMTNLSAESCFAGKSDGSAIEQSVAYGYDNGFIVTLGHDDNNNIMYKYWATSPNGTHTDAKTQNDAPGAFISKDPGTSSSYQPPRAKEDEWAKILNDVLEGIGIVMMIGGFCIPGAQIFAGIGAAMFLTQLVSQELGYKMSAAHQSHFALSPRYIANGSVFLFRDEGDNISFVGNQSKTDNSAANYLPDGMTLEDSFQGSFSDFVVYAAKDSSGKSHAYFQALKNGNFIRSENSDTGTVGAEELVNDTASGEEWFASRVSNSSSSCDVVDCGAMSGQSMFLVYTTSSSSSFEGLGSSTDTTVTGDFKLYSVINDSATMGASVNTAGTIVSNVVAQIDENDGANTYSTSFDYTVGKTKQFFNSASGSTQFTKTVVSHGMQSGSQQGTSEYYFLADSQDSLYNPSGQVIAVYSADGAAASDVSDWMKYSDQLTGNLYYARKLRSNGATIVSTHQTTKIISDYSQENSDGVSLLQARGTKPYVRTVERDGSSYATQYSYNGNFLPRLIQSSRNHFDPKVPRLIRSGRNDFDPTDKNPATSKFAVTSNEYRIYASDISDYKAVSGSPDLGLDSQNRLNEVYLSYKTKKDANSGDTEYLVSGVAQLYNQQLRYSDGVKIWVPYTSSRKESVEEASSLSPVDSDGNWAPTPSSVTGSDWIAVQTVVSREPVTMAANEVLTPTGQTRASLWTYDDYGHRFPYASFTDASLVKGEAAYLGLEEYEASTLSNGAACDANGFSISNGTVVLTGADEQVIPNTGNQMCGGIGLQVSLTSDFNQLSGIDYVVSARVYPESGETCALTIADSSSSVTGDGNWHYLDVSVSSSTSLSDYTSTPLLTCGGSDMSYLDDLGVWPVNANADIQVYDNTGAFLRTARMNDNGIVNTQLYDDYRLPYASLILDQSLMAAEDAASNPQGYSVSNFSYRPGFSRWGGFNKGETYGINPAGSSGSFNDDTSFNSYVPNSKFDFQTRNMTAYYYQSIEDVKAGQGTSFTVDSDAILMRFHLTGDGGTGDSSSVGFGDSSLALTTDGSTYTFTWTPDGGTPQASDVTINNLPSDVTVVIQDTSAFVYADGSLVLVYVTDADNAIDTESTTDITFAENGWNFADIIVSTSPGISATYLDAMMRGVETHDLNGHFNSGGTFSFSTVVRRLAYNGWAQVAATMKPVEYTSAWNPNSVPLMRYRLSTDDKSNIYSLGDVDWSDRSVAVTSSDGTYVSELYEYYTTGPGSDYTGGSSDQAKYGLITGVSYESPLARRENTTVLPGSDFSASASTDLSIETTYQTDSEDFLSDSGLSGMDTTLSYAARSEGFSNGSAVLSQGAKDLWGRKIVSRRMWQPDGGDAESAWAGFGYTWNPTSNLLVAAFSKRNYQPLAYETSNTAFTDQAYIMDASGNWGWAHRPDMDNSYFFKDANMSNRFVIVGTDFTRDKFADPGSNQRAVYFKKDSSHRNVEIGKLKGYHNSASGYLAQALASDIDTTFLTDSNTCKTTEYTYDIYPDLSAYGITVGEDDPRIPNIRGTTTTSIAYGTVIVDVPDTSSCDNSTQEAGAQVVRIPFYDQYRRLIQEYTVLVNSSGDPSVYQSTVDYGDSRLVQSVNYPTDASGSTGQTVYYQYDRIGRVANVCDSADCSGTKYWTASEYDDVGRLVKSVTGDGYTRALTYDYQNNLTDIAVADSKSTSVFDQSMGFYNNDSSQVCYKYSDIYKLDQMAFSQETGSYVTNSGNYNCYAYDGLNRLSKVQVLSSTGTKGDEETFSYDSNGNLYQHVLNGEKDKFVREDNNNYIRSIEYGGETFTPTIAYNGNYGSVENFTTQTGQGLEMTRDSYGQMVVSATLTANTDSTFDGLLGSQYDDQNREVSRQTHINNLADYDITSIYGAGIVPLVRFDNNAKYILFHIFTPDGLSAIRNYSSSTEAIVEDYYLVRDSRHTVRGVQAVADEVTTSLASIDYTTMGQPTVTYIANGATGDSKYVLDQLVPQRFQGHLFDQYMDLHDAKARYYDTGTGRFLSVDPGN